jgi:glutathione peroxidase
VQYAKISVKGADQAPLYAYLTKDTGASITGEIKWNFTKSGGNDKAD